MCQFFVIGKGKCKGKASQTTDIHQKNNDKPRDKIKLSGQSGCHSGPDGIQKYQSDFLIKSIDDSKVAILPDTGKSCQFSKGGTAYEHRIWQKILPV